MNRPSKRETFLEMANVLSLQSTCIRRSVGCILTNKYHHIVGSGYNGTAAGSSHCIQNHCDGNHLVSGKNLEQCQAIHAEQNALMQCKDIHDIEVAYVTTFPCMHCMKMLLNTSCKLIVYNQPYDEESYTLWIKSGRIAVKL